MPTKPPTFTFDPSTGSDFHTQKNAISEQAGRANLRNLGAAGMTTSR
ncbi:hypothetical protein CCHOA_10775 [Corynebacterium choanae]|uniref:Uncharacterized protein n=1 Tax=Corynebacterium choanae TaxID=1862358 RepID=A0A3G6JEG3_9CORY|nr:hypothetical protein CCHOA_10775 [Corynebacterium choanae]